LLVGACRPADPPVVVYLLRHAEKEVPPADTTDNPPLDPAGFARAEALVRVLGDAGVTRILSTDYQRTRQTVQPLADRLGLTVELYDGRALADVAEMLRGASGRILVSGHSNTTPDLVDRLGGDPGSVIDELSEFDRLYVLHLSPDGTTTMLLRYGE
ncbi:MAG: phosphoglycerate mutase family protein, partial [Rhodothermales bacterium]|nr:phosphoglycerate mutase family protein [Rhodothermales bacterium]